MVAVTVVVMAAVKAEMISLAAIAIEQRGGILPFLQVRAERIITRAVRGPGLLLSGQGRVFC
jgi:hypothetical protein